MVFSRIKLFFTVSRRQIQIHLKGCIVASMADQKANDKIAADLQKIDDKNHAEARKSDDKHKAEAHNADDKHQAAVHKADDKRQAEAHKIADKEKVRKRSLEAQLFHFDFFHHRRLSTRLMLLTQLKSTRLMLKRSRQTTRSSKSQIHLFTLTQLHNHLTRIPFLVTTSAVERLVQLGKISFVGSFCLKTFFYLKIEIFECKRVVCFCRASMQQSRWC